MLMTSTTQGREMMDDANIVFRFRKSFNMLKG